MEAIPCFEVHLCDKKFPFLQIARRSWDCRTPPTPTEKSGGGQISCSNIWPGKWNRVADYLSRQVWPEFEELTIIPAELKPCLRLESTKDSQEVKQSGLTGDSDNFLLSSSQ